MNISKALKQNYLQKITLEKHFQDGITHLLKLYLAYVCSQYLKPAKALPHCSGRSSINFLTPAYGSNEINCRGNILCHRAMGKVQPSQWTMYGAILKPV